MMLVVTETAATAIRGLVEESQFDEDAGLRFSADPGDEEAGQLTVALAPMPAEDDERLESSGARVFLDRVAAEVLADKILDAGVTETGELGFSVTDQSWPN
jgi:iron-sulfur cluster assembly protein